MDHPAEAKTDSRQKTARDAVIEILRSRNAKARFMTELNAALVKSGLAESDTQRALAQLESDGVVMVRDHFCADPHLAGADLRVVTVVEAEQDDDPQLGAIRRIDEAWNKWLNEYLANHRCG
jgi:hypothetical protein